MRYGRRARNGRSGEFVDSLAVLVESFVDAVEDRAPFLVPAAQMLDMIAGFEAIVASLETGAPVTVTG